MRSHNHHHHSHVQASWFVVSSLYAPAIVILVVVFSTSRELQVQAFSPHRALFLPRGIVIRRTNGHDRLLQEYQNHPTPFSSRSPFGIQKQPIRSTAKISSTASVTTSTSLSLIPHDFLLSLNELAATTSHNAWTVYGELLRLHPISTKAVTAGILAATGDAIAQFQSFTSAATAKTNACENDETQCDVYAEPVEFQYDARRGATFLAFGALYTGAFQHYWFTFLSSHIADWGHAIGVWGSTNPSLASYASYVSDATQLLGRETTNDILVVSDLQTALSNDEWWSYFDIMAQATHPPSDALLAAAKVMVNQFGVVPLVYMPLFFAVTGALGGLDANQSMARARSLYQPLLTRNYFFWLPTQFVQFFLLPPEWQIPFVSMASLLWTIVLSSVGGGLSASKGAAATQSQIVAYEPVTASAVNGDTVTSSADLEASVVGADLVGAPTTTTSPSDLVTVVLVDAGPVNALEDQVLIGEIRDALVPDDVSQAVKGVWTEATQGGAKGVAIGLLASSAADASIGAAVGRLVNGEVGVGVALVTAVSAGVGIIAATTSSSSNAANASPLVVSEEEMELVDDPSLDMNSTASVSMQEVDDDDNDPIEDDRLIALANELPLTTGELDEQPVHPFGLRAVDEPTYMSVDQHSMLDSSQPDHLTHGSDDSDDDGHSPSPTLLVASSNSNTQPVELECTV